MKETAKISVNVADKLSKISEIFEKVSSTNGYLLFNGKICNLDDDTFYRLKVPNGATITLNSGAGGNMTATKWIRFTRYPERSWWIATDRQDSVSFIP